VVRATPEDAAWGERLLESTGDPPTLQGGYQPRCRVFAERFDERAMNGLFSKASKQAA